MSPFETLLIVFSVLIIGGTSYELYNETKSHHKTKHYRERSIHNQGLSKSRSRSRSKNDFFGLFKKSRKNKSQKSLLKDLNNKKITAKSYNKLFNLINKPRDTKHTSPDNRKKTSFRKRKNTSSMNSLEKRQYYLDKFKHNVHKTKKRRRRVYI
uniref:Uncharacterized protein n=1 Tax=viral metagenome TaxID=1070528 RepID=A0A6C0H8Y6_9ZZZZ